MAAKRKPDSRFDLPSVIRGLVERLMEDDWIRFRSEDGADVYYVIGADAWGREVEQGRSANMEIRASSKVSILGEHLVRAAIAAAASDKYVKRAGERLGKSGITVEQVTTFLAHPCGGNDRTQDSIFAPSSGNGLDAIIEYLEAVLAVRVIRGELELDPDLRGQVAVAREKLYLREMAERYSKVVKRSELLEPLGFADPQLEEASRCYLYGFYRAAIVLAAAALESHLKTRLGVHELETYNRLVHDAWIQGLLGEDLALAEASKKVFSQRTKVVHLEAAPVKEDAEELITLARRVVAHLVESLPAGE